MTDSTPTRILTSDLDYWEVQLSDDGVIEVRAHGFAERDGFFVFVALMRGTPHYEYELVRIAATEVKNIDGGWTAPRRSAPGTG